MSQCVIDGTVLTNGQEMYCSNACKMKAYRRRAADKRIEDADERRRKDANAHKLQWTQYFKSSAGVSGNQADKLYHALIAIRRLHGTPYEQEQLW